MITYTELLNSATTFLKETSESPWLDAAVLLSQASGLTRTALIAEGKSQVSQKTEELFWSYINRSKAGEPVAYIIGEKEFWGLPFYVDKRVLVPRPDSELIIEEARNWVQKFCQVEQKKTVTVLDLGTGSGCLATSIAYEFARLGIDSRVIALDLSMAALEVAKKNIERHKLQDKVKLICANWFEALRPGTAFDLIVANPPYISYSYLAPVALEHEPKSALYAADHGLREIKLILDNLKNFITRQGLFLSEIGDSQGEELLIYCQKKGFDLTSAALLQDLGGRNRVLKIDL